MMVSAYERDENDMIGLLTVVSDPKRRPNVAYFPKLSTFFFRLHHILALWKNLVRGNLCRNKMIKDMNQETMPPTRSALSCTS